MATAWHSLTGRIQQPNVIVERQKINPGESFIKKQRFALRASPVRSLVPGLGR